MYSPESYITLVTSPELIKDIKNATNDQLSLHAAAKEVRITGSESCSIRVRGS
jgi:hypothetical protein